MIYSGNSKLIYLFLNQSDLTFFIPLAILVVTQQSIIDLQQPSDSKQKTFLPSSIFFIFAHYLSRISVTTSSKTTFLLPIAQKISIVILFEDSPA